MPEAIDKDLFDIEATGCFAESALDMLAALLIEHAEQEAAK